MIHGRQPLRSNDRKDEVDEIFAKTWHCVPVAKFVEGNDIRIQETESCGCKDAGSQPELKELGTRCLDTGYEDGITAETTRSCVKQFE